MKSPRLVGDLSIARVADCLAQADDLAAQEFLDLSAVTRIDSGGAALLLELSRRASSKGHRLRIQNANAQTRGLLEFLGLQQVLNIEQEASDPSAGQAVENPDRGWQCK